MDTIQTAPTRPFFWSYSALDNFERCPKKFYHTRIAKDFTEPEGEALKWGYEVHEAFAKAVNHSTPLPPEMAKWEAWVRFAKEPFDRMTTIMKAEVQLAIDDQLQPCEYFDKKKQVWFRAVADVLKIKGEFARIVDWKTGKSNAHLDTETGQWKTDSEQLNLTAAVVMAHFPIVQHVKMDFVWLKEDFWTSEVISRTDLPQLWQRLLPRINKMRHANATGVYEPTLNFLCRKHCPVKTCQHHGASL